MKPLTLFNASAKRVTVAEKSREEFLQQLSHALEKILVTLQQMAAYHAQKLTPVPPAMLFQPSSPHGHYEDCQHNVQQLHHCQETLEALLAATSVMPKQAPQPD